MQINDFVQWELARFTGCDFEPKRGWIVAVDGEWAVVRILVHYPPDSPFAVLRVRDLEKVEATPLAVRRGAGSIS
jgi:hypothetical protein